MKKQEIKVGFCVAYDWYLLQYSLPLIYPEADIICLSLDKDRIGWAGQLFDFDEQGFKEMIKSIDIENKISILEEDYHLKELSPMQNEVRQRNKMASFLGSGGWHIQLDADEYFIDFKGFIQKLHQYRGMSRINICVPFLILFKEISDGWLMVSTEKKNFIEYVPVATLLPHYEFGRRNSYFNHKVNYPIVHQSWARSEEEIGQKVRNWGHKNDFDTTAFTHFWKGLDENNYKQTAAFHPIEPELWPSLKLIPGQSIQNAIQFLRQFPPDLIPEKELKLQNSLFRSRVKAFLKKVGLH